jgi:hypothetical protein
MAIANDAADTKNYDVAFSVWSDENTIYARRANTVAGTLYVLSGSTGSMQPISDTDNWKIKFRMISL